MALLSIITVNLNNYKGLKKTMESVFSQTFKEFEYIVIDGWSNDGSKDLIMEHEDKINYWVSESDTGIYEAMNKGIEVAKGKYCLFLNSGDYLYNKNVLHDLSLSILTADFVYGDTMTENNGQMKYKITSPESISTVFLMVNCIVHQSQLIKRDLFLKFGMYSNSYLINSDYEFTVKMHFNRSVTFKHIPVIISVYDLSGISSQLQIKRLLSEERKIIHKLHFPKRLFFVYYTYINIRSWVNKIPFLKRVIARFNKLIVRLVNSI